VVVGGLAVAGEVHARRCAAVTYGGLTHGREHRTEAGAFYAGDTGGAITGKHIESTAGAAGPARTRGGSAPYR
jgi:hypothetical protein